MISSRTPEGEPIVCGVCGHASVVEPSCFPTPDATCPCCGSLVWVRRIGSRSSAEQMRARKEAELIAECEAATKRMELATARTVARVNTIMARFAARAEELLELVARRFGPLSNATVSRIRQMSPAELDALAAVLEPGDADPAGWVGVLEALYAILEPATAEGTR